MPRFFLQTIDSNGGQITGEDAKHISRSLRCKIGEELAISDCNGTDYLCKITEISDHAVSLATISYAPCATELATRVVLYQAMPKSDKLELIAQKAVELGVSEIVPVLTKNCVSRPDDKSMTKKIERLNKIMLEAAKQCGRGRIPTMRPLVDFKTAIGEMRDYEAGILFYERATAKLGEILSPQPKTIAVMVGAEGGFDVSEVDYATQNNISLCTMGSRILRCETAAIFAMSVIGYEFESR